MLSMRGALVIAAWLCSVEGLPPPLDLEAFEDADCVSAPGAPLLLELMAELCDVAEDLLQFGGDESTRASFQTWSRERGVLLVQLSGVLFARPFCEPGKVAGAAATCLLMLGDPADQPLLEQAAACVQDIDSLLQQTSGDGMFDGRLHMFLRSPWPAFRLLDLVVRLHPSNEEAVEAELGRCVSHEDWMGEKIDFDWQWFKSALLGSLDLAIHNRRLFELDPADGPLSEQYRARWLRLYRTPSYREAAAFGSAAFYQFRRNQWHSGCNPGIVAAYLMQVITFSIRDTEAWLQRYVGAAWRLLNTLSPVTFLIHTDWPLFRALHVGSMLRRSPRPWAPGHYGGSVEADAVEAPGVADPAAGLQDRVRGALDPPPETVVYVTAAWGPHAGHLGRYVARWLALALPLLLVLALDADAASACGALAAAGRVSCVEATEPLGIEATVVKYIVLSVAAQCAPLVVWLDLDVYLPSDPTERLLAALEAQGAPPLAMSSTLTSRSLSPSVIAARGQEASELLLKYATWLYEHPYILDHQGWDAFLQNPDGDFHGGWDYKGRNITSTPGDGLQLSFASILDVRTVPRHAVLGREFASGDGLLLAGVDDLAAFHFWGALEPQRELFEAFYPFEEPGFSPAAREILRRYVRSPLCPAAARSAARGAGRDHITAITYADGCCAKSMQRNRETALANGVDAARAYGRADLDEEWAARHAEVLALKKGAGWWLWKPYVVLRTLQDEAVPWHSGVVLWLDAGNYYSGDPRPVVAQALRWSDVAAMRLKCCTESDWTSAQALEKLGGDGYAIADLPQLGAYFLALRKTEVAMAFVEEWLRLSEDPDILLDRDAGGSASLRSAPGYQRHMADQSVFSVLFKQGGFEAMSLELGHQAVQLDRWRE